MKKNTVVVLLSIIIIAAASALYFSRTTIVDTISRPAVEEEKKAWQQKTKQLEGEVSSLKEEIQKTEPEIPREKLQDVFGAAPAAENGENAGSCEEAKAGALKFFSYLDQRGYLKALSLEGSADEQYRKIIALLENNRPLISGETQDLYTLMRNISFFYRILGAKNIRLVLTLLSQEAALMEPTMKLFFAWTDPWQECAENNSQRMTAEALYDYAGFFITTIAGHSYLARRDSKIRTLVLYYSVVILDKANEHGLNKYGIDIRQPLNSVIDDLETQRGLLYRRDYLQAVNALKKKYPGQTTLS
jgi:hypothetical protein